MDTGEQQGDELLLGRLQEAAGGEVALRQLRRRYDALRQDYESLLDRLSDIEARIADGPSPSAADAAPPVPSSPTLPELEHAIRGPLLRLRDDYAAAVARIQRIIAGLEALAASAGNGPHDAMRRPNEVAPESAPPASPPPQPDVAVAQASGADDTPRPTKVGVEVYGKGFGELLDFQEKLSSVPGVSRVSINAIDAGRATLVVELHRTSSPEQ
jgi:hypothetical protein